MPLNNPSLSNARVVRAWWPLAASWLLMSAEPLAVSAVVARLANPEINLAAYGGIVFPLSLITESPIIMLLAASTALSKDLDSYRKLERFMWLSGGLFTFVHFLLAFTPLYDLVVSGIMGAPPEIIEPGRLGLRIMTPWTLAIAYRRFQQGVMIRFGHSQSVSATTLVRLVVLAIVLAGGYALSAGQSEPRISGIVVGSSAIAIAVIFEAVAAGRLVRPVLHGDLRQAPPPETPLTVRAFMAFYIPLALTPLILLLSNPIGSAAISRMPQAIASLAVWPVLTGFVNLFRNLGTAYNEVVVALLDEPGAYQALHRFRTVLAVGVALALLLTAATPLSDAWFRGVSALAPELAEMARRGVWLALPLPALTVLQSWFQGNLLHARRTRAITEAVLLSLLTTVIVLTLGVRLAQGPGLYVGVLALGISAAVQVGWLGWRSRGIRE